MEGEMVPSLPNVQKNTPVWAALAHNVLDFPGTSVGSSRRQLGRNAGMDATESAVQMTMGDSGTANDSMMEVEEETSVTNLGDNLHLPSTVGMDYTSTRDMPDEEDLMTAIHGTQAPQTSSTPACDATQIERGPQPQIQTQVGSRPFRHGLDNTATRRIVGRLGAADADNMTGSGGAMLRFGRASLITTPDQPSPPAIDWASLGQSEFDLPSTSVSASRSRPDTQLVINLETLPKVGQKRRDHAGR
jgi:hypothetical protein